MCGICNGGCGKNWEGRKEGKKMRVGGREGKGSGGEGSEMRGFAIHS